MKVLPSAALVVLLLATGGCGGSSAAADRPAPKARLVPIAWQRAVRPSGHPDELRIVYTSVPGRRARSWRVEAGARRDVVTLLARPRGRTEDAAAVTSCFTLRSAVFAARHPIEDGAVVGKSPSERRALHDRDVREAARLFPATADNCPVLQRR